ncbi:MAG: EutN/CcmL family microcompartment protein [Opitutales bacterium]
MRVGRVIGKVVLGDGVPAYRGGRWLLVSPCDRAALADPETVRVSAEPSLVVYDDLGAGPGDLIGFTEGGEATRPFDRPMPVDAYNCCLLDRVTLDPRYLSAS